MEKLQNNSEPSAPGKATTRKNNSNPLKKLRRVLAVAVILMVTLLFVDFTGTSASLFGWIARIQFLPALLALNVGVIIALVLLTLLFGRVYCSVICPLGIMQDLFGWLGKKSRKNRYTYSAPKNLLRYTMLALMIIAIIAGVSSFVAIFAPYSAYGRIVSSFLQPVWIWINNLLAGWAEAHDSYAFYTVEQKMRVWSVIIVAAVTLVALAFLSWRNGRTYCNTVCPVGTVLGFFSRFSLFRPVIDRSKCVDCKLCSRNCKAACINIADHKIDYSRCVSCFDCIGACHKGAISYTYARNSATDESPAPVDGSRRQILSAAAILTAASAVKGAEKFVDGGLAEIEDKKIPERKTKIVPPGALSHRNLNRHCTSCQLCIASCPNGVLRPSSEIETFMQPESSYENGYCRPECTKCSEVCPTGAIRLIDLAEKSSVQIGHAVWIKENCVPLTDGVKCGNCARHCPTGAITMVENESGVEIPVVNTEKCIGCGACENLCPSRPFSAIYVEGHENHRII